MEHRVTNLRNGFTYIYLTSEGNALQALVVADRYERGERSNIIKIDEDNKTATLGDLQVRYVS